MIDILIVIGLFLGKKILDILVRWFLLKTWALMRKRFIKQEHEVELFFHSRNKFILNSRVVKFLDGLKRKLKIMKRFLVYTCTSRRF